MTRGYDNGPVLLPDSSSTVASLSLSFHLCKEMGVTKSSLINIIISVWSFQYPYSQASPHLPLESRAWTPKFLERQAPSL